jgi:hypothetical protein
VNSTAVTFGYSGVRMTLSVHSSECPCLDGLMKAGLLDKRILTENRSSSSSSDSSKCLKTQEVHTRVIDFPDETACKDWVLATEKSINDGSLTYSMLAKSVSQIKLTLDVKSSSSFCILPGESYQGARNRMGKNRNSNRILKTAFMDVGRAKEIPKSECATALKIAAKASAMVSAAAAADAGSALDSDLPIVKVVLTIDEWKKALKEVSADNRDVKLALMLADLEWTTTNKKKEHDSTKPVQSSEETWFCIVRKAELTPAAKKNYSLKMTCVHTPRRGTQEEALSDREIMLKCEDVNICMQALTNGRTAFDGRLAPNLRLEDCRFAVRYDSAAGERRLYFNIRNEAEVAAVALNDALSSPEENDKLVAKIQVTTSVVLHGSASFSSTILLLNACRKAGTGATSRMQLELNKLAAENNISLKWRDVRDECKCPPGYCLAISAGSGDDMKAVEEKLDCLLSEFPEAPVIIMNRGLAHALKNRHLADMSTRPYWALAYQPCNYNQVDIGEAMTAFFSSIGLLPISKADLHEWSSEASDLQMAKRFKISDYHERPAFLLSGEAIIRGSLECSHEGCSNRARLRGGMCKSHGGGVRCSSEGCSTAAVEGQGDSTRCRVHFLL